MIPAVLLSALLNFGRVVTDGAAGLTGLLGFAAGTVAIPALIAIWSFREERERAPRLPTIVFSILSAGTMADRLAGVARAARESGSIEGTALVLAFSIGTGLIVFTLVCVLAGLFRSRERALSR